MEEVPLYFSFINPRAGSPRPSDPRHAFRLLHLISRTSPKDYLDFPFSALHKADRGLGLGMPF